jgi:hypothetical protein
MMIRYGKFALSPQSIHFFDVESDSIGVAAGYECILYSETEGSPGLEVIGVIKNANKSSGLFATPEEAFKAGIAQIKRSKVRAMAPAFAAEHQYFTP